MSGNGYRRERSTAAQRQAGGQFLAPDRNAATGPDRPRLKLLGFRPMKKGALRGFAEIELPIGLTISDVPILVGKNGAWAALPAKPQTGPDGKPKTDANGKPAYVTILKWRDRALNDGFSAAVIAAVLAQQPDALDDGSSL